MSLFSKAFRSIKKRVKKIIPKEIRKPVSQITKPIERAARPYVKAAAPIVASAIPVVGPIAGAIVGMQSGQRGGVVGGFGSGTVASPRLPAVRIPQPQIQQRSRQYVMPGAGPVQVKNMSLITSVGSILRRAGQSPTIRGAVVGGATGAGFEAFFGGEPKKKYRRMNYGNMKAANRAIRRIKGARRMLQKIERQLPKRTVRASSPRHVPTRYAHRP